jgi:hypothetical protein
MLDDSYTGHLKIRKKSYAKGGERPKTILYGHADFCVSAPAFMRVCGARSRRVFGHPPSASGSPKAERRSAMDFPPGSKRFEAFQARGRPDRSAFRCRNPLSVRFFPNLEVTRCRDSRCKALENAQRSKTVKIPTEATPHVFCADARPCGRSRTRQRLFAVRAILALKSPRAIADDS